ncbi:MAG: ABC transporter permease [Gemmatimonadetes bacterium]|nr:ABC transporter permease [Gemmatimonadota bacterium]MDA1104575.1 ABC transporter permease [Gemmatimonadota bacterium]
MKPKGLSGGVLVALVAAVGLLVGLRSIAALDGFGFLSLLDVESLPREGLGLEWSSRAIWPVEFQSAAILRLVGSLAWLFLAGSTIAALNALILVAEAASARRRDLALRSALGATPLALARMLLAELRTLFATSAVLGLLVGMMMGAAGRATWAGALEPVRSAPAADLLTVVLLLSALVAVVHCAGAWRIPRSARTTAELKAGARVGADPGAVFGRNVLAAFHTATAGAILVAGWMLAGGLGQTATPPESSSTVVIEGTAPTAGAWTAALSTVRALPGVEAESLAAPGALLALGVRDIAIAECGACSRGGLPAPLWNALADHHVVAPGYFDLVGLRLVEGRVFTDQDSADGEPVVVISRAFARSSFEKGLPLGKRIRIGTGFDSWYRVVGVIEDWNMPVLGAERVARETVYLSALQNPVRSGALLVRGDAGAVEAATEVLAAGGFHPDPPVTLSEYRKAATAPLRWAYWMALVLGVVALLLAAHGIYSTALQTSRRRATDLAIRRAVGAPARSIVTYVLRERLKVTGWGLAGAVFLGTLAVAFFQGATGVAAAGPVAYLTIGAGLTAVAVLASIRSVVEAMAVEPSHLLK